VTAAELAVALVLGLVFGSFANVCIHRIPERRSVVWPGSACPRCGASIAWYDNIPVLSWLVLQGRCRACRAPIHWRYPLVEATSALLLVQLCLRYGLTLRWAALSYLALSILVLVPIDWKHGILPDVVTLPAAAVGLVASFLTDEPGRIDAMLGAAVGGLVPLMIRALYMAYVKTRSRVTRARRRLTADPAGTETFEEDLTEERREGMGLGDVKMLSMVGAFLGVSNVLLTMMLGSVLGSIYVVPLVLARRHSMKTAVTFGPFLGLAAILSMLWGRQIIAWYTGLVVNLPIFG